MQGKDSIGPSRTKNVHKEDYKLRSPVSSCVQFSKAPNRMMLPFDNSYS